MIDDYEPAESLLDGDFSCETTEDLYEPTDENCFIRVGIIHGHIHV